MRTFKTAAALVALLSAYAIYRFVREIEISYEDWYWDANDWEAEDWAEFWGEEVE